MRPSLHNSKSIRRRIRLSSATTGKVYSFSTPGKIVEHTTTVDLQSGRCSCTCEAFKFSGRLRQCKHVVKHLKALIEKSKRGTLDLSEVAR